MNHQQIFLVCAVAYGSFIVRLGATITDVSACQRLSFLLLSPLTSDFVLGRRDLGHASGLQVP